MEPGIKKTVRNSLAVLVWSFFILLLPANHTEGKQAGSEKITCQKVLAEFTIEKSADIVLLPVEFKGEQHWFIFDTGASWVVFDSSFRNVLGDARRSVTATANAYGGSITLELFDAPEAFLGPFNMQDCGQVACMDLKKVNLALGKKVSGVIGMSFLKKHVIQIDYDEGKLSFLKPKSSGGCFSFLHPKGIDNPDWGEKLSIKYNSGGIPQIEGNVLNGGKTYFWIDTGAAVQKCLESKIFRNILKHKGTKASEKLSETTAGTAQNKEIRIDKLFLGSLKYKGLISNEGKLSLLGTPFLSRHIVTFDFPNNAIYLKRGMDFDRLDEVDMTGLQLIRISNKTTLHSVDQDSPAYEAGLKAGDIILKVNNKDANEYSRWELSRLKKSGDGDKIKMTIKRGDNVKEVSFVLKKRI